MTKQKSLPSNTTLPMKQALETRHYRIGGTVNMCRIRTPKTPPVDEVEGGFEEGVS